MLVGVARVDITPSGPIRLSGYGSRKTESEGVEQHLFARAVALGANPVVLVSVENCGVPAAVVEEVANRLKARSGLPRERFALGVTHTHSAPMLGGALGMLFGAPLPADQVERINQYTHELTDKIEQAALAALADRRPGQLAWTQGQVGFAANRRVLKNGAWTGFGVTPDAPVDHALPLLRATDAEGHLRAVVVGYACHCTTLGGEFNKICGDWAGLASETIERDHPRSVALIVSGCGADANPEPRGTLADVKTHGTEVVREVDRLLAGSLTPLPGTISAHFTRITLPFGPLPTRDEWVKKSQKTGAAAYQAKVNLERLDRGETLPTSVAYPIQTWCFGDELAMVFLAGEVVVDYDLRLKRELDARRLWINAYCNDVPCYIASKRILREGGYEADDSMVYYDRPTRLAPEAEDRIIEAVHHLLPATFQHPKEKP